MRYATTLASIFLSSCIVLGQPVTFGVKGGALFTHLLVPPVSRRADATTGGFSNQSYATNTKPYTIGPVVEVRLPLRLAIEFDALYKHFNYDHNTFHQGIFNDQTIRYQKVAVGRWEFPLLVKYRPWKGQGRPFISGGPSVNYISGTHQQIESITAI